MNIYTDSDHSIMAAGRKYLYTIIAVVIVVVVIVSAFEIPALEKPKQTLPLSEYYKVSSSDLLNNSQNAIYFISWYGCPIGADNSWVLYSLINGTRNISSDVVLHKSIADTPGLLFLNNSSGSAMGEMGETIPFSYGGVPFNFTSLYVYNQTLTGSITNQPIANNDRISFGLNFLQSNLPNSVYQVAKKWETQVNEVNQSQPIAQLSGHLVTMLILTGPDGTYVHFWFMYPSLSSSVLPSTVYSHLSSYTSIQDATIQLITALGGVNSKCA